MTGKRAVLAGFWVLFWIGTASASLLSAENPVLSGIDSPNTPNRFTGTDSQRIAAAVADAPNHGGLVRIPSRVPDAESDRNYWLIDEAILLPGETTLLLDQCKIKLSDAARDNIIRSANCGLGIEEVVPIQNVRVIGIGTVILEGADHPRSTGDSNKKLGDVTYGTDAGKEGERPFGDWRNIGILMANVENFTLQNFTIREPHAWSISLERCSEGRIANIDFFASENRVVDGVKVKTLNQDGLNLRKGCHHITIENLSGQTGDDLLALTAINPTPVPAGTLDRYDISGTREGDDNDIHHVIVRNLIGFSNGGHQIVRVLNSEGIRIHHVIMDGILDASPEGVTDKVTIKIGDQNPAWGGTTPLGDTFGFQISNVQSKSKYAIMIQGSLTDSIISGVINYVPESIPVYFVSGKENVRNVIVNNIMTVPAP